MSVGPSEVVVILLVVLLLFGSRRLADLGKGIGEGIRGFRRGIAGESDTATAKDGPAHDSKTMTGSASQQAEQPLHAKEQSAGSSPPGVAAVSATAVPSTNIAPNAGVPPSNQSGDPSDLTTGALPSSDQQQEKG